MAALANSCSLAYLYVAKSIQVANSFMKSGIGSACVSCACQNLLLNSIVIAKAGAESAPLYPFFGCQLSSFIAFYQRSYFSVVFCPVQA